MLVLSRSVGEKIRAGEIKMVVLSIKHGRVVSLGFEAPEEIVINREEVHQDIERNGSRASRR